MMHISIPNGCDNQYVDPFYTLENGWAEIEKRGVAVIERYLKSGELPHSDDAPTAGRVVIFKKKDYSDLYYIVYLMCTQKAPHNYASDLYDLYADAVERFCKTFLVQSIRSKAHNALEFLLCLRRQWKNHQTYIRWLSRVFAYLDRYYVKLKDGHRVETLGIVIFYNEVYVHHLKSALTNAVLKLIGDERHGETIDRELLRDVVVIYSSLEVSSKAIYFDDFEGLYESASLTHFTTLANSWMPTDTFPTYLKKVENTLLDERDRCEACLQLSTGPKIQKLAVDALLKTNLRQLLAKDTAIKHLLTTENEEGLKRTFELFALFDTGLSELAVCFKAYVYASVEEAVNQHENRKTTTNAEVAANSKIFVDKLLLLHETYTRILVDIFETHFTLRKALRSAFETAMNIDLARQPIAHHLAVYADRVLRKTSNERLSETVIQTKLDGVVELFSYLSDKDHFAEIYRGMLAKRLLQETSLSADLEKHMISHLKSRCGTSFTTKLEGMVRDLNTAAALQSDFATFLKQVDATATRRIEFSSQVLTTSSWPQYTPLPLQLPKEMSDCIELFETFYISADDRRSRRLGWIHTLGTVSLEGTLPLGRYYFSCTTVQACVLLLFNHATTTTTTTSSGGGATTSSGSGATTSSGGGATTSSGSGATTSSGGGATTSSGSGATTSSGGGATTSSGSGATTSSGGG
eukprot:Lankesteria_metandrocarpae@DN8159_c0_g1_i1.p1